MSASEGFPSVAWLGAADDPRLPLLRHFGLQIDIHTDDEHVDASISPLTPERVLDLPPGPALLLVNSAEQEAQWLSQLPLHVEPVREPASALLIYERLRRLLARLDQPSTLTTAVPVDPLTSCLSRAGWTRQLQQRLYQPLAEASALMLVDLDGFRAFNERHGHAAGDRVLAELARRCRAALGPHDVIGRWSGDRFALLLQRYDRDSVTRDAQALLALFGGEPITAPAASGLKRWLSPAEPALIPPGASAGLAWLGGAAGFAELLDHADGALQLARRQGGRRLRIASRPQQARARAQIDAGSQMGNRDYFDARLARESESADREGWPLALWLIDLRGLSSLNAAKGHSHGDAALTMLATAIREQARLVDWTARVRASALVVVMPHTDAEGARHAVKRLRSATAALLLPLSDSLALRNSGEPADALLERAWQQRQPMSTGH